MLIKAIITLFILTPVTLFSQIQISVGTGITYHRLEVENINVVPHNTYDFTAGGEFSYTFDQRYILFSEYKFISIKRDFVPLGVFILVPINGFDLNLHYLTFGGGLKLTDSFVFKTAYYRHFISTERIVASRSPGLYTGYYPSEPFKGQGAQLSVVYKTPIKVALEFVVNVMVDTDSILKELSTYSLLLKAPLIWRKDKE